MRRPKPTAPLAALACGLLLLGLPEADAREAGRRGPAVERQEFPRLPPAPTLPGPPRPIAPGSLNGIGDWTRPVVFGGARLGLPNEIRLYLCPRGGTPGRNGRCVQQAGPPGLAMGVGRGGDRTVEGWHEGLRPASHAQRGCPAGTLATQARDNPGVTRCVPA